MAQIQSQQQQTTALAAAFNQDERFNPKNLAELMGSRISADSWIQAALAAFKTPGVLACQPMSVLGTVYKAARLRLPIDGVHFSLIPFKDKCEGVVGYPGWVALYVRHAGATHVQTGVIFEGERYEYEEGLNQRLVHAPDHRGNHTDPEKVVAVYAVVHLRGGQKHLCVVWRDVLDRIREVALAKAGGKQSTYDGGITLIEMWRKAAIIRARKGLAITDAGIMDALAEAERDEVLDPREAEVEAVQATPIRTPTDLSTRLGERQAAREVTPEPQGNPTLRVVHGVLIALQTPIDSWSRMSIKSGDPLLNGKLWSDLVETADGPTVAALKSVVVAGASLQAATPGRPINEAYQRAALVLQMREPPVEAEPGVAVMDEGSVLP